MGERIKHCVDCGAEFKGRAQRCPSCRIARKLRMNVVRNRQIRAGIVKTRVCRKCGADISHLYKSTKYCAACASWRQPKWEPWQVEQRLTLKIEAQRKRTEKVLAAIDAEFGVRRRGRVDEAVSTYTDRLTGNKIEWRGMRCGAGGRTHHD